MVASIPDPGRKPTAGRQNAASPEDYLGRAHISLAPAVGDRVRELLREILNKKKPSQSQYVFTKSELVALDLATRPNYGDADKAAFWRDAGFDDGIPYIYALRLREFWRFRSGF